MTKPDMIVIDGHAFSWQRISELRREQLAAWNAAQPRQLVLFALQDAEKTAIGNSSFEIPSNASSIVWLAGDRWAVGSETALNQLP